MNLLTVLAHEVAHLQGGDPEADDVMAQTLTAGTRRDPAQEARLAELTDMLSSIDVPVDAITGFDPTYPWSRRRK